MCESCGCGDETLVTVDVHDRILARNETEAAHNRETFRRRGILAVNIMGSPGSGKTAVLEATAHALAPRRLAAIAGDLATERDAERLRAAGLPAISVTTGTACHLDAAMVHRAYHQLPATGLDYLFIENVGNLVCPAVYDLGQCLNVVALSVTEGEDKPLKYPSMFARADLVLLTKVDLLHHLDGVRVGAIQDALARVMPAPNLVLMAAPTGFGVGAWVEWLEERRRALRSRRHVHAEGVLPVG